MTVHEIVVALGYEIDKNAEKKINDSIKKLKSFVSETLEETGIRFKVDEDSESKVKDSIEQLGEAADSLKDNTVGFEVDEAAREIVFQDIDNLNTAAQILEENEVGFEVNEATRTLVFDSIDNMREAAEILEENTVAFQVDRRSENEVKARVQALRSFMLKALGVIGIGFSLAAIRNLAEEFGDINVRIADATRSLGDQHEIQQRIKRAANDARQDYAVMANTINRLAMGGAFEGIEEASNFATLMAQDFAAAGQSQEKSAYLTRYITMDLQKGKISARTMTTALRDAPHIVNRLADSLDVSVDALLEMSRGGELSADILKNSFLDSADEINARFAETDMTISDALTNVRNGWGLFIAQMDDTIGVSGAVARTIVSGFNQVLFVMRRVVDMFMRVADRLGGVQNLMRLLAITAGAIFAALKANAILGFLRKVQAGLKGINKKMILAKLKVLAIVAVIVLLALLIEDFIGFMRGEDSLLGELLEKFGVDADNVREIIKGVIPFVMELAKAFGGLLLDALKMLLPLLMGLIRQIMPPLIDFIRRLLPIIFSLIEQLLPVLINLIERLLPVVFQIIDAIVPVLIDLIEMLLPIVMQIIDRVLPIVIKLIETFIDMILPITEMILPLLMTLLEGLIPVIVFVAELLGNVLGAAFEGIVPIVEAFMGILSGLIDFVKAVFIGDWAAAWEAVKNIFSSYVSGLAAIFKLPINAIITMLNTFISGLNRIRIPDWVPGVGGKGIDIPEIPMLAKGSDFSPDTFIAGEEGPELITNAKGSKVFTAAETADTLGKINALANWEPPSFLKDLKSNESGGLGKMLCDIMSLIAAPAKEAAEAYHTHIENKTVTQYNEFYNEFHGDRAGQEKSAEAMDSASEDVTGQLARALAYVQ